MKLKDIGEFGLIKRITSKSVCNPDKVIQSIGDDAAVFRINNGEVLVFTTDLLIEGSHFIKEKISPSDLGYKAISVNLSDIAAMGAKPEHIFISLGIPDDLDVEYIDNLYKGMKEIAGKHSINILGGDTSSSKNGLFLNIAMTGAADPEKLLYRNTAVPGDVIFATGYLGSSKAGLHLIRNDMKYGEKDFSELILAHVRPYPFVEEGIFLAGCDGIHAAIDVSDGLISDLGHVADQSGTGYSLDEKSIPVSEKLRIFCDQLSCNTIEYAVTGGEDYILLFTADPEYADNIMGLYRNRFGHELHRIGKITSSKNRLLIKEDGTTVSLVNTGWDHFRSA